MPMSPYRVSCCSCDQLAQYKIASAWNDGVTQELKPYALCCATCLPARLCDARARKNACRLTAAESLESPGIYEIARGTRDARLCRRPDLEAGFSEFPPT